MFLEILQNSQQNICARVCFLIKLQAYDLLLEAATGGVLEKKKVFLKEPKACNFIKKKTLA